MKVIVDSRETRERKEKAQKVFGETEIKKLYAGDYVYENTAIELKTNDDFISSIKDKRVFRQAREMNKKYENTFVVVYGNEIRSIQKAQRFNRYFTVNNYIGAIASLSQIIRVLQVPNEHQAFTLMRKLFEKSNDSVNRNIIHPKNVDNKILGLIMYMGNMGQEKAEAIIKSREINSFKDLLNLEKWELMEIEGIGPKTADRLINNLQG